MVPVMSLWLPIVLSAVVVFVLSSVIHMLLKYHENDHDSLPNEEGVMGALRPFAIPPGDYAMPRPKDMAALRTPEYQERAKQGPVAFLTVLPNGVPTMGKELVLWFVYSVVVGIFAAYVAGRALGAGANYLEVFRFVGAVSFVGYGLALWQNTIWYHRKWTTSLKNTIDALVYALFTAGVFGWLWPV